MRCINCHLHTGHFRGKASEEVVDEAAAQEQELEKAFPASAEGFKNYAETIPGSTVKVRMVAVPGGTFEMGSPASEPYRHADEGPVHHVKISPFWMERTEVTWREYEVYLLQRGNTGRARDLPESGKADGVSGPTPPYGSPDQGWGRGSRPAITMTLSRCRGSHGVALPDHRQEVSAAHGSGVGIRRPRECHLSVLLSGQPQFVHHAALAEPHLGVKTAPLIDFAWYQGDSLDETHPGGVTKPNGWGLEDMLGNVREFCLDWYQPDAYAHVEDGAV